jgi:hypothetical protein
MALVAVIMKMLDPTWASATAPRPDFVVRDCHRQPSALRATARWFYNVGTGRRRRWSNWRNARG